YESAAIDGATRRRQLRHVTLPLLSPVLFFVSVVVVINSLQSFGQIDILTGGGPASATNPIVYEIYQNAFAGNQVEYANAETSVLLLLIMVLTGVQYRIGDKKVHYQLTSPKGVFRVSSCGVRCVLLRS